MATKSFTSLEQSKKLAGILPLESADYCWGLDVETSHYNSSPYPCAWKDYSCKEYYIPCWSLAALFKLLPKSAQLEKGNATELYRVTLPVELESSDWHIESVDACYEMILKLNELKML